MQERNRIQFVLWYLEINGLDQPRARWGLLQQVKAGLGLLIPAVTWGISYLPAETPAMTIMPAYLYWKSSWFPFFLRVDGALEAEVLTETSKDKGNLTRYLAQRKGTGIAVLVNISGQRLFLLIEGFLNQWFRCIYVVVNTRLSDLRTSKAEVREIHLP